MEWYQKTAAQVLQELQAQRKGLSDTEAVERRKRYGANVLSRFQQQSLWPILLSQVKSPVVYLLFAAAAISFGFGDITEGFAILVVILINSTIGFIMEKQAVQSMRALRKLDRITAKVYRNGKLVELNSEELVPGDVFYFEAGDMISADARLLDATQLQVDESALTGESLPVHKHVEPIAEEVSLGDRTNMVYKGTAIARGNGKAVVVSTAMDTEIGQISKLVQEAEQDEIPLNKKLESFSKKLIWLVILIAMPIVLLGLLDDRDLYLMIETAIALAVAAIPEGLPIVATIALARGMLRLAKHKVIVKKLAAVETLGETNVIFTDKTGTLTENKLKVNLAALQEHTLEVDQHGRLIAAEDAAENEQLKMLLRVAALCNNASYSEQHMVGDPLEVALLQFVADHDEQLLRGLNQQTPRLEELPFDSDIKVMATLHQQENGYFTAAKGATEALLGRCTHALTDGTPTPLTQADVAHWTTRTDSIAVEGLKVLAFAYGESDSRSDQWASDLVFIGLVGFLDPARADVPDAIAACKDAGIKVVMVTGDHPETARTISHKIGLVADKRSYVIHGKNLKAVADLNDAEQKQVEETLVFSRVSPLQKLELVKLYKQHGHIVAMTGDGVNDAPALKQADIGIAMGIRGTQVAREAADMVLQDDAFPSIVVAIKHGRIIFNNIKNFIIYLMSCNLSEILVVSIAAFGNLALPLQPLQILFLNVVTDVFPALALGMGRGNASIMKHPPRNPKEPLLNKSNWISIGVYAAALSASVFSVFLYGMLYRDYTDEVCNNIAFLSLAFAQLLHPLNLISRKAHLLKNDITRNPHLWAAVIFCVAIIMAVYYIPYTKEVLNLQSLPTEAWTLIGIGSVAPVLLVQLLKRLRLIE